MKSWTSDSIKSLRTKLGLTQKEFGKEIKRTRRHVGGLESGEYIATKEDCELLNELEERGRPIHQNESEPHRPSSITKEEIKKFRKELGLIVAEFAELLEASDGVVRRYESGDSVPTGIRLERLLKLMKQEEERPGSVVKEFRASHRHTFH